MAATTVLISRMPEIIAAFRAECSKACKDAAEATIKVYSATTPVDSGLDKTSGYVLTNTTSTYGVGAVGEGALLPELEKPSDDQTAIAAVASEHAVFPEYGTRDQAAQPAFVPAVDAATPVFTAALMALEAKLAPLGIPAGAAAL